MSEEILNYIKDSVTRIEKKQDDQAERIVDLEKWQANANGKITMLTAFGVALGGIFTAVADYFRH